MTWERCKPWIADARDDIRPTYLYQLERMVVAHQLFRQRTIAVFRTALGQPGNGGGPAKTASRKKSGTRSDRRTAKR